MTDSTTTDDTWAWRLCTLNPKLQKINADVAGERLRNEMVQSYKNKEFYPVYVNFAREELQRNEEFEKPTVEGLESFKQFLRSHYIQAVSHIDEHLKALQSQLDDESISETRRAVIPQYIEDTQKKLRDKDIELNKTWGEIDSVIEDIKGLEDKVNGLKELASNQINKRRRTALSLEQNLDDLRYALDAYETRREYCRHISTQKRPKCGGIYDKERLYSVHTITQSFKKGGMCGSVKHNLIIHPAGVVGCDRSNAGGSLGSRYGHQVQPPEWRSEWGAEKPFCDCDSFRDFVQVDTSDLLYSALRSVERALRST